MKNSKPALSAGLKWTSMAKMKINKPVDNYSINVCLGAIHLDFDGEKCTFCVYQSVWNSEKID